MKSCRLLLILTVALITTSSCATTKKFIFNPGDSLVDCLTRNECWNDPLCTSACESAVYGPPYSPPPGAF
jgi:hypothetical protein